MTDELDLEEQRLLMAARTELTPDDATAARVRAGVSAALLVPAGAAAVHGAESSGLDVLWRAPGLGTRLAAAFVLSAGAGLVGYGFGVRSSAVERAEEQRAVAPVVIAAPASSVESAASATLDARAEDGAQGVGEQEQAEPQVQARPQPRHSVDVGAAERARAQRVASRALAPRDALQFEIAAVKAIENELRAGNPSRALQLLNELDDAVPQGQLRQERSAARAIARCTLGVGDARAEHERFVNEFAGSVYEARVRARCDEPVR